MEMVEVRDQSTQADLLPAAKEHVTLSKSNIRQERDEAVAQHVFNVQHRAARKKLGVCKEKRA